MRDLAVGQACELAGRRPRSWVIEQIHVLTKPSWALMIHHIADGETR